VDPPLGWTPPPRAPLSAAFRTLRVGAIDLGYFLATLALDAFVRQPSTTTAEGLPEVNARFKGTLARLGVRLEIRDAERVPAEGGLVFMWNQESHLDHLVLGACIPRPFFSLYNNAVARVPLYGAHMRRAGHVHVDRNDEAQWRTSVARAAERVARGECVLVSPEGTRSWDGELLPMKRGAFLLAATSKRPIVCVTLIGGHARMPRGTSVVRPGPLHVVFSDPIPTSDFEPVEETLAPLMSRVADVFSTIKRENALGGT
jgi:1-acyl-sn-glycerol-3-phosphate acyltransferase